MRKQRPVAVPAPVVRFETPAGTQAQVDFAQSRFPWGKRYASLVVLGYSRLLWCPFYPRQDMRTLVSGLEEAFAYFGGVPQERLVDQMKAVITRDLRLLGGALVQSLAFPPVRRALGLHAAGLSPVSRANEGHSRAPGPLRAGHSGLRAQLPARR